MIFRLWRRPAVIALLAAFLPVAADATQTGRGVTIDYTLSAMHPLTHLYDVEMEIHGIRLPSIDVAMPAWAAGDFRIRDFARNVQEFSAETSERAPLAWRQIDKQTWRITKSSADDVHIHYRLFSSDLGDDMADVASAATFLYVPGNTTAPVSVKYDIPANWNVYGSLEKSADRYRASSYDVLADSPAFLGNCKVLEFTSSSGVVHRIVFSNPKIELTGQQVIEDLRAIVDSAVTVFGAPPYKNYTFLVRVRGGIAASESLEHLSSARMTVGENDFVAQASYRRFIAGAARALVRTWIGKQIHPEMLDRPDYSREAYTRLLWFMDGVSTYYASLLEVRTGFLVPLEYYARMEQNIAALQRQPGRLLMSLENAGVNAWSRSDNSAINTFSYSSKDEIAALLLDMEIRGRSNNQKSLDDVMRYLVANFGAKGSGVPEDGIPASVTAVAGAGLAGFFDAVVRGKADLEYNQSLQSAGLAVDVHHQESGIYFGIEWERTENNQVRIRRVDANSPAERAMIDAGDVWIALDSERITSDNMVNRIHARRVGVPVTVTFLRGERLLTTQLTPGETREDSFSFIELPTATPEQIRIRNSWLGMP